MKIDSWGNGEALEKIRLYKRQILKELYDQCTEGQQVKFNMIFPKGLEHVPEDKVESAIELCERTVVKNNKNKKENNNI